MFDHSYARLASILCTAVCVMSIAVACDDPTAPSAAQLVITTSATGASSGSAFQTQPVVEFQDASGNIVPSADGSVTMTVSPGGTIFGTPTVTATNGVATFSNVGISGLAGTTYTLTFSTPGLPPVAQSISLSAGAAAGVVVIPPATSLLFEQRPLSVEARDAAGNLVSPGTVTWSSSNTSVATVNETGLTGLVTPVSEGVVTITATVNGKSGSATITVLPITFASLTAGSFHTCGLTSAGSAYCWGENSGRLGDGTTINRLNPVAVQGGITFQSLAAGGVHTCGLTEAGKAYCWGDNNRGQLGDGTTLDRVTPVEVQGGFSFISLAAGGQHTCGLTSAGAAYCWGWNHAGQVGDGTVENNRVTPVAVQGGLTFVALTAGGEHTCGLTSTGAAYCWGHNDNGQLGDNSTMYRPTPVLVHGGLTFSSLTTGQHHTCGVTSAGALFCWGHNSFGQLGDGTRTDRLTPTPVAGGLTFTTVTAGFYHTCGTTNTGAAYCWGHNGEGQVGNGTTALSQTTPDAVQGGLTFRALADGAGQHHTCGLTTDSRPYCWGGNPSGQVGDGTSLINRPTPVPVDRR